MNYLEFKQKRENNFSSLPIFFAFNDKQFQEGMKNFGLEMTDVKLIASIGSGGFIQIKDKAMIKKSFEDLSNEFSELMKDDSFFIEAMVYELGNHEFGYTYDPSDTFASLNLTVKIVTDDERMNKLFLIAKTKYFEGAEL